MLKKVSCPHGKLDSEAFYCRNLKQNQSSASAALLT
jgi:hypothetical protein